MAKEILDLIERFNRAVKSEKAMRTALTSVLAVQKQRIFQSGQDSNRSDIGSYSTKKISIAKNKQARSTGHTTFPGGYAQYHQEIGKGTKVNFRNTDQMMMDYGIVRNGNNWGFGFQNAENYNKSQWVQDHFDKDVLDTSEQELDILADVLKFEIEKIL